MNKTATTILEIVKTSQPLHPTIKDIMRATGIKSTSVVCYYLDQLEDAGMIKRERDENGRCKTRGILPKVDN